MFWYASAVLACLLGMATKEVMVTAPLVVLLYDRTFLAGSFAEALRRRWGLYLALAATWGLLAYLVVSTGLLGRRAGVRARYDWWSYACTQPGVILYYLRLCLWPQPLCLDYGWPVATCVRRHPAGGGLSAVLVAATVWGLVRRKAVGFPGGVVLRDPGADLERGSAGASWSRASDVPAAGGGGRAAAAAALGAWHRLACRDSAAGRAAGLLGVALLGGCLRGPWQS